MENTKLKPVEEQNTIEESSGKAIRISSEHHAMLNEGRKEINGDPIYRKKISTTRYVEKLIETFWKVPIEELKKEREGAEDWLKIKHLKEAPNLKFYDWLRIEMEGNNKKTVKRNKGD